MSTSTPTITQAATVAASATRSCITATLGKYDQVPINDCRAVWLYSPSIAAAIIFAILFGICTTRHIIQAVHYRMKFCWVIIQASAWETAGFTLRSIAAQHQISLGLYLPEELLILLAPIWINAFDYMLLGRMIYYFLPEKHVFGLPATKFALVFVLLDVSTFIIQSIGIVISSSGQNETTKTLYFGIHVYMGGLALQEFCILCFSGMVIKFHRRMFELEYDGTLKRQGKENWRALTYTLYASLTFISIRIIFRLVQFSSGLLSPIPTHEVYFYVLEAVPMLCALSAMNIIHPGRTLVGPDANFPGKGEKKVMQDMEARLSSGGRI